MEKNCTNCKWYTVLKNYLNQDLPICRHEVAVGYEDTDLKICCCTYYEPKDGRRLADQEWLTELKEAKRLLRLAVEDINAAEACDTCEYYPVINSDMCQKDDCYKWRYLDEALKLIGGSENG